MRIRSWGVAAALILAAGSQGKAEDSLRAPQGVACSADGGRCTRFQSFVYVRRGAEPTAPFRAWSDAAPARAPEPGFGGRRVYLHMGAAETH